MRVVVWLGVCFTNLSFICMFILSVSGCLLFRIFLVCFCSLLPKIIELDLYMEGKAK